MTEKEIMGLYSHGDAFTAKINGYEVSGNISFCKASYQKQARDPVHVFYCYNVGSTGDTGEDILGYTKSWIHDKDVKDLVITPKIKKSEIINNYPLY